MAIKKKSCYFCEKELADIDYKDSVLHNYLTGKGKIIPAKLSGVCAKHQRKLTKAVKKARAAALLPYAE